MLTSVQAETNDRFWAKTILFSHIVPLKARDIYCTPGDLQLFRDHQPVALEAKTETTKSHT
jgi:hypothetical protein